MPGFLSVVGCRIIPQKVGPLGIQQGQVLLPPVFEIICGVDGSTGFFFSTEVTKIAVSCTYPSYVLGIEKTYNVLQLKVEPRREKKLCSEIENAGLSGGTFGWPLGNCPEDKPGKALFLLMLTYEESQKDSEIY